MVIVLLASALPDIVGRVSSVTVPLTIWPVMEPTSSSRL